MAALLTIVNTNSGVQVGISRTDSRIWPVDVRQQMPYRGVVPPRIDNKIPDLVSLAEAAAILGTSKQLVHRDFVQKGLLAGKKIGGTWVFRRIHVEMFLAALKAAKDPPTADHYPN